MGTGAEFVAPELLAGEAVAESVAAPLVASEIGASEVAAPLVASEIGPATGTILPAGEAASGAVSAAAPGVAAPEVIGTATGAGGAFVDAQGTPLPSPGTVTPPLVTPEKLATGAVQGAAGTAVSKALSPEIPTGVVSPAAVQARASDTSTIAPRTAPVPTPSVNVPTAGGMPIGGGAGQSDQDTASSQVGASDPAKIEQGIPDKTPRTPTADSNIVSKGLNALGLTKDGSLGPNAIPAAALGLSALSARGSTKSLQGQLTAAAKPAATAANKLLSEGLSGQSPQFVIDRANNTYNDTVEAINQRYVNMGRDPKNDSAAAAEIAKAAQARDDAIAAYASTLTSQGLKAAGLAQGPVTEAAVAGAQADQNFSNSIASTLNSMALLGAIRAGQGGAP